MSLPEEELLTIEPGLKRMILIELVFPVILLVLGIYHGMMQVLYRAGMIRSRQVLGLEYFQGLTLHGVINAIVFTTFFAVAFGHALVARFLGRLPDRRALWASLVLMTGGTLMAAVPMLIGQASVLYTFYAPLRAHFTFYLGATL